MTRKQFVTGLAVVVVVFVALGSITLAKGGPHGMFGRGREMANTPMGRMIHANIGRLITLKAELNITEEQHSQIKDILTSHKKDFTPVVKNIVDAKRALHEAVLAEEPVKKDIQAAADKLGDAIGEGAILVSEVAGAIRDLLTPEQIALLQDYGAKHKESVDIWLGEMSK